MSGGGKGQQTQTVEKQNVPDEFKPLASQYASNALTLAGNQIPYYEGQRMATVNPWQTTALNMTAERALSGSPVTQAAQGEAQKTLQGGYLSSDAGVNPYMGSGVGTNPYAGQNPYLDRAVETAQNDEIRKYQTGVAPQLDRAAAQANAFGNSGYGEAMRNNQEALGRNLGNISSGMRMQDYTQQQQLAESGLNRDVNVLGMNAGLAEGALGRGLSLYQGERGNQMRGLLLAPQLAQADYQDAQALGQAGDASRQFGQESINDALQRWQEQAYMPYTQNDMLGSALGVGSGLGGTANSFSPSTRNPLMGAAGGAMSGAAGGAALGSYYGNAIGPGYGALAGAAVGGLLGYYM